MFEELLLLSHIRKINIITKSISASMLINRIQPLSIISYNCKHFRDRGPKFDFIYNISKNLICYLCRNIVYIKVN